MPLSAREQRVLAQIEDQLNQKDPEFSDLFRHQPLPRIVGRWHVFSLAYLGLLVAVLLALVLAHPLAALWGATGVGLLTAALVMPWVVTAARAGARLRRKSDQSDRHDSATNRSATRPGREDGILTTRRAALPIGLTVWAVVVALVAASGVGFADAALVAFAVVMLGGVHVARCFARRDLIRRFGLNGGDAQPSRPHPED